MKYLFVHDAFPGQFIHLLRHLSHQSGTEIVAASREGSTTKLSIKQIVYGLPSEGGKIGPRKQAAALGLDLYRKLQPLVAEGWKPNVIVSHASTGAASFLKDLFPSSRFISFLEWYYRNPPPESVKNERLFYDLCAANSARNSVMAHEFDMADAAYTPTTFQRGQFPPRWQTAMEVCHEGIDIKKFCPNPDAVLTVGGKDFAPSDEIITYAARGMEHTRGFAQFMQAIALVQKRRPNIQVLIAGSDRQCYDPGGRGKAGLKSWAEKNVDYDPARTHFVGLLPERDFINMLQVSSLHTYLSIPFVLSWSCLNAMSVGVPVLASNNAPVQEFVAHKESGLLVDPTNVSDVAEGMLQLLDDADLRAKLGGNARETIVSHYSLEHSLERLLKLFHGS